MPRNSFTSEAARDLLRRLDSLEADRAAAVHPAVIEAGLDAAMNRIAALEKNAEEVETILKDSARRRREVES